MKRAVSQPIKATDEPDGTPEISEEERRQRVGEVCVCVSLVDYGIGFYLDGFLLL